MRVERDGAFAAAALDAALHRGEGLDPRDRALATELVYGVLRTRTALDEALGTRARDGVASLRKLDAWTRAVLHVAAYQILALGRVPPRAAVDAAVEAVKHSRTPRLAGFVNAVLRGLASTRPEALPDDARVALALRSVPEALRSRVAAVLGDAGAEAFLRAAFQDDRAVVLRVHTHRIARDAVAAKLRAELPDAEVTYGRVSPLALRVSGGGDPATWTVVREGLAAVQEEAAQCVALMAEVAPGARVLDVCAGRGGKSAVAAMALAGRGTLHAVDLHPDKLAHLRASLSRWGLDAGLDVAVFAADLTRGLGGLTRAAPAEGYDVVLVDAPCSGLGTVGHRPDALMRLRDETAWGALVDTQSRILAQVAPRVRPGGVLVYAVCTLDPAEGDGVVEGFLAAHEEFAPSEGGTTLPERLHPHRVVLDTATDGTDGFMAWRLRRR